MDMELMQIQMKQDFEELAEQYDGAADNENLWALGAETDEAVEMHQENARHCLAMAKFYRYLATRTLDLAESYEEEN